MDQYSKAEVRRALEPFHDRIGDVIRRGFEEWLHIKEFMLAQRYGPVLYPRTAANHVFDAIAPNAIREFGPDVDVWVKDEVQTVKFCFGGVVVARFKKGDDDNLGQNHPTQAVIEFIDAQQMLPGFPPEAAKVEFIWVPTVLEDAIDEILVVARDGDRVLWTYPIEDIADRSRVIELPISPEPDDGSGAEHLVTPKTVDEAEDKDKED